MKLNNIFWKFRLFPVNNIAPYLRKSKNLDMDVVTICNSIIENNPIDIIYLINRIKREHEINK